MIFNELFYGALLTDIKMIVHHPAIVLACIYIISSLLILFAVLKCGHLLRDHFGTDTMPYWGVVEREIPPTPLFHHSNREKRI